MKRRITGIVENAIQEQEKYRASDRWLHNALPYNHGLYTQSNCIEYKPVEVVELWVYIRENQKERSLVAYNDKPKTHRIRRILEKTNEVNSQANIMHRSTKLNTALVAMFHDSDKFTLGGRMYTRGRNHYQGLPSEYRREILIDGQQTIEIDYSGHYPYLLYAKEGIQYRGDPYTVINDNPVVRPFLKTILLCMVNSDWVDAQRGANNELVNEMNDSEREALASIGITKAAPLMEQFMKVHQPIAHHLCAGKITGMKLMNMDSRIAIDVVNHFSKQGIPILCIHDSFIVQKQYRDELYEVMKNTYQKHTGFSIKMKQKTGTKIR